MARFNAGAGNIENPVASIELLQVRFWPCRGCRKPVLSLTCDHSYVSSCLTQIAQKMAQPTPLGRKYETYIHWGRRRPRPDSICPERVGRVDCAGCGCFTVGQVFDKWEGDVGDLKSTSEASTVLTVPERNLVLTALYKVAPPPTYLLTVQMGIGGRRWRATEGRYLSPWGHRAVQVAQHRRARGSGAPQSR